MSDPRDVDPRAAALRRAFDASFAVAPSAGPGATVDVLLIRVGAAGCAIRAGDITAVVALDGLVPVPSAAPDLLGLVARRGEVVPVFALAGLLGRPADAAPPRWMVICDPLRPIGLAFAGFERFARIAAAAIVTAGPGVGAHDQVTEVARVDDQGWPVVAVNSVVDAIRARVARPTADQGETTWAR